MLGPFQWPLLMALLLNTLSAAEDAHPEAKISREEFLKDLNGAFITEEGSYGTKTGSESEMGQYIVDHWATLLDQLDDLPPPNGNRTLLVGLVGIARGFAAGELSGFHGEIHGPG